MARPRLDQRLLPFLIGVPLTWAVVLLFHPAPDPRHIHLSLQADANRWLVVHCLTLVFIGLMGGAVYLLVRDLTGAAAQVSRIAVGPFVLFYGAGEAILGVAVGVIIQHANDASAAHGAQVLWDSFLTGDLIPTVGAVAWAVATLAAAVAFHRAGSPLAVSLLLGLSAIVLLHGPPIGPIGLTAFAAAVALLARGQTAAAG